MKMVITVVEVAELINEIKEQSASLFEMIRKNVQEQVGQHLSALMDSELTPFLGRDRYIRSEDETNHRNRRFSLFYRPRICKQPLIPREFFSVFPGKTRL